MSLLELSPNERASKRDAENSGELEKAELMDVTVSRVPPRREPPVAERFGRKYGGAHAACKKQGPLPGICLSKSLSKTKTGSCDRVDEPSDAKRHHDLP